MKVRSTRLGMLALVLVLTAQSVFAARIDGDQTWFLRVRHLIVTVLDQLGVPGSLSQTSASFVFSPT